MNHKSSAVNATGKTRRHGNRGKNKKIGEKKRGRKRAQRSSLYAIWQIFCCCFALLFIYLLASQIFKMQIIERDNGVVVVAFINVQIDNSCGSCYRIIWVQVRVVYFSHAGAHDRWHSLSLSHTHSLCFGIVVVVVFCCCCWHCCRAVAVTLKASPSRATARVSSSVGPYWY